MKNLLLLAALLLLSCVRKPIAQAVPREDEDPSIRFPAFYERFPVTTGEPGEMYALDGVTLQALTIATNDFIPQPTEETLCWRKPAAHRYRFVRQGDIIFVRIDADAAACTLGYGLLDYGVQYAISTDGRILRRLYDGEPEDPSALPPMEAGPRGPEFWVDPSKVGDTSNLPIDCDFVRMMERSTGRKLSTRSEECQVDAGTPQEPSSADGGEPPAPAPVDGGTPPPPPVTDGGTPPP